MTSIKRIAFCFLIVLALPSLWAQNRYALVIGNADYTGDGNRLPNTINDTVDISAALRRLGYDVILKQNLQYLDMIQEVETFTNRLRNNRDSEGFFWYAGHAMEIEGDNFLLPLNVNLNSETLIKATSFSVTNLTRQLDAVRNKLNVVVLDACRVPPSVGGSFRSSGDTSRVIKTLPVVPSDLMVIYSTASGQVASDGTGKRNSPFTEAFLNNINSTEPLSLMVNLVARDTMNLTNQRQRPYTQGSIIRDTHYSLNQTVIQPTPPPSPAPSPSNIVPAGLEYSVDGGSVTITKYTGTARSLDIPAQIQGLPVTAIGYIAFYQCSTLTSITIPSSVTSIGREAFGECTSLTSITIPSSVTSIDIFAFNSCTSLTSITIPSSVTSIGYGTFVDCASLTSVTIPSSVTSIDSWSFIGCKSLTGFTVDNRNPVYTSVDGVLFDKDIRTIIRYPEGKTARNYSLPSSVVSIGDFAFKVCSNLTGITIPSSVILIGVDAFAGCMGLTGITIPSSVISIDDYAFHDCTSLTSITADSRNPNYASRDGVLFDKNIQTLIKYPEGKTARNYTIPSSVTSIGSNAFNDKSLTSFSIPSTVTFIRRFAFVGCNNLTSVTLSRRTQVGDSAFPITTRITYRD